MENTEDKYSRDTQPIPLVPNQDQFDEDSLLDQDQVPTPRPFAIPMSEMSQEPQPRTASKALWVVALLALLDFWWGQPAPLDQG